MQAMTGNSLHNRAPALNGADEEDDIIREGTPSGGDRVNECKVVSGMSTAAGMLRIWQTFRGWRRRRGAIVRLHTLDDRLLKDMGIERSEIESVVCGLGRDVSRVGPLRGARYGRALQ
jgi:uncharacterized protein YjiS (DUF1127 family)